MGGNVWRGSVLDFVSAPLYADISCSDNLEQTTTGPCLPPLFVRTTTPFAESALNAIYSRAICCTKIPSAQCTNRLKMVSSGSTEILSANSDACRDHNAVCSKCLGICNAWNGSGMSVCGCLKLPPSIHRSNVCAALCRNVCLSTDRPSIRRP